MTPVSPATTGNGLAMRAGLFLEGMAQSHDVTVAIVPVFGVPPPTNRFVASLAGRCVTLELLDPPCASGRWPTVLLSTPEGRLRARELYPLPTLCRPISADGRAELEAMVREVSLVHVMRCYLAPCLDFMLDAETRPALTLDLDELDSAVYRQLGNEEEARRLERLERYYIARADHVYTAAEADAELIRNAHGAVSVTDVPNAPREPGAVSDVGGPPYDLLFVGNLSYAPNIEAVKWLCHEIRPLLNAQVTIALVGRHPPPEVLELSGLPGVTVAGDVPEVTSWYARARIAVAPLRMGGGTRTKIVEAQAHGLPVITTPLGAAGIATGEEKGVVVAERTEEFAHECLRLLTDSARAKAIGLAGRAHVVMAAQVIDQIDQLTRAASRGAGTSG